jgi:hypothetical protein
MAARLGEVRHCERCGAEIVFLRHDRTGKLAPMEALPNRAGAFTVDWQNKTYATFFGLKELDQDYYQNHYATCPSAQFFRERTG